MNRQYQASSALITPFLHYGAVVVVLLEVLTVEAVVDVLLLVLTVEAVEDVLAVLAVLELVLVVLELVDPVAVVVVVVVDEVVVVGDIPLASSTRPFLDQSVSLGAAPWATILFLMFSSLQSVRVSPKASTIPFLL